MKKMNLKFFGLGAKIVLPLFLLVGLFLSSATTTVAQDFKSVDDAAQIIQHELILLQKLGADQHTMSVKSISSAQHKAEFELYDYTMGTLSHGDVQFAVEEAYKRLQEAYPESPMKEAVFQAYQKALEILTY